MRFRRARRARAAPAMPGADTGPMPNPLAAQRTRLIRLLDVVTRAIALQADADDIIAACGQPGDTPVWVARSGGRLASAYCRLHAEAAELSATEAADSVQVRATQLISYHATMVDMCLKLAFPNILSTRLDNRRRALDGLGEPASVLRDLRTVITIWLDDLDA